MRHYQHANFRGELCDANSFEQWSEDGSQDMQQRACAKWKSLLNEYEMPTIDVAVDEALLDFIARRKTSMADALY
jgi:trimethylamine--corrinoid protein Co-methyltransferase